VAVPAQPLRPLGVSSVWAGQGAAGRRGGEREHPKATEGHWGNSEETQEIQLKLLCCLEFVTLCNALIQWFSTKMTKKNIKGIMT